MNQLPAGLNALSEHKQFLLRDKKVPKSPHTGLTVDAHDPSAWVDFPTAQRLALLFGYQVGFVLTQEDPFFFIDIDDCRLASGEWSDVARGLTNAWFPDAFVEESQSGRGLHIIAKGAAPEDREEKCKEFNWGLYTEKRFVALTGNALTGNADTEHTTRLEALSRAYLNR